VAADAHEADAPFGDQPPRKALGRAEQFSRLANR
jgi:hypothetical protein